MAYRDDDNGISDNEPAQKILAGLSNHASSHDDQKAQIAIEEALSGKSIE